MHYYWYYSAPECILYVAKIKNRFCHQNLNEPDTYILKGEVMHGPIQREEVAGSVGVLGVAVKELKGD